MNQQMLHIREQLTRSVEGGNLERAEQLVRLWRDADDILKRQEQLERKLAPVSQASVRRDGDVSGNLRKVLVEITGGALRQSYFPMTQVKRKLKLPRLAALQIEIAETGARFQSQIARPGNFLRNRKRIAEFYEAANIDEGDYVLVCETSPNELRLTKVPPPDLSDYK